MSGSGVSPTVPSEPSPVGAARHPGLGDVKAVDSADLFAGRNEIRLHHRGEEYRLRITRQGKLILTK